MSRRVLTRPGVQGDNRHEDQGRGGFKRARDESGSVSTASRRRYVLAGLLVAASLVAAYVLWQVVATVFFAVTVAYVLYPARQYLRRRGLSRKQAAATLATVTFGTVSVAVAALAFVLYRRRHAVLELLRSIPAEVTVPLGAATYTVETTQVLKAAQTALTDVAVGAAAAAPVFVLKLVLFAILLFGLLVRPGAAGAATFAVVPPTYHDIVRAYHARVRGTLNGIYVLQAATAFGTFVVALVVFFGLGYNAVFTLAVVAGVLQFVPVVGPGLLVAVLAVVDLIAGEVTRAVAVAVLGSVFIGLLPDAVIRPRLASYAAHLPTSLYFIGFTGGILTVGPVGFIAGPLAVALVVESVELLAAAAPETGSMKESDD